MTEYELNIAENEGHQAFRDNVPHDDCPYEGVSDCLYIRWRVGWLEEQWGFE